MDKKGKLLCCRHSARRSPSGKLRRRKEGYYKMVTINTPIIALLVVFYSADAGRVKRQDNNWNFNLDPDVTNSDPSLTGSQNDDNNWNFNLNPDVTNGDPSLTGSLEYQKDGFKASAHYTETFGGRDSWGGNLGYENNGFSTGVDYKGTEGYDRFGGHVGYENDNFNVKGTGFTDSAGNWGIGASFGWSWKRSLEARRKVYVLRLEADPCQFMVYDRNQDGSISYKEVHDVFADNKKLADDLFGDLDADDNGEVSIDEFENEKVKVIVPCALQDKEEQ